MKSNAPFAAGVSFVLIAIVSASVLITPSKPWQFWLLNQAHQLIADTEFIRIPYASALAVGMALGLIAAVAVIFIFAKLEIIAAGWASEKSVSALKGRSGELSVEEEVKQLVKKYGRR